MLSDEKAAETGQSPPNKCSDLLREACKSAELQQSAIREISTYVSDLYRTDQLNELDKDIVGAFIEKQCKTIQQSKEFRFDLFEICLSFYAAKEMPRTLYRDSEITILIKTLNRFCTDSLFSHQENYPILHRLFPILRLFSRLIERCALTESLLSTLDSIAETCYFLDASSTPLQSAACSLLCAIFKRFSDMRLEMLDSCFFTVQRSPGNPKNLLFSKNERKQINAFSILLLELMQSSYVYQTSNEETQNNLFSEIFTRFLDLPPKHLEKFSSDLLDCLTHPFYPITVKILPAFLNLLYSHVVKKTKFTRCAIRSFCDGLAAINEFIRRMNIEMEVTLNPDILEYAKSESSNIKLMLDRSFPRNETDRIISELCILGFIRQSFRLFDSADTASLTHIAIWGEGTLDQDESECLGIWSGGRVPEINLNGIEYQHIEKMHLLLSKRFTIFSNIPIIISRLLSGLQNKNSTMRGMVLKGFSAVVQQNTEYLYHQDLIPLLEPAFIDPCASVRDAALEIVATYIEQHEKITSPYFPQIIHCLSDSSSSIVRRSLVALASLAQTATHEQLSSLCSILFKKLDDPSNAVKNSAKSLLFQAIFEYSSSPTLLISEIVGKFDEYPKLWVQFVKECYIKFTEKMQIIINEILIQASESPTTENVALLFDFVRVLPSSCASNHEKLITSMFLTESDAAVTVLANIIAFLIPYITFPVVGSFKSLIQQLEKYVMTKGTGVVRPVLELYVSIVNNILPDDSDLKALQFTFADVLIKNQTKQKPNEQEMNDIQRSIFVTGVLFKLCGWISPSGNINKVSSILGRYYMWESPIIRSRVLNAFVDICIRDPNQIRVGRNLVSQAFKRGDTGDALNFIKILLEEEYKAEDTSALDENRPNSTAPLIEKHLDNIKACFSNPSEQIRSLALDLISVSLTHGLINAHEVLPYVIGMLTSKKYHKVASDTIKGITFSFENALKTRIGEGLSTAYEISSKYPEESNAFGVAELYTIISPQMRRCMMNAIVSKCVSMLDITGKTKEIDSSLFLWLMQVTCAIKFDFQWEPAHFMTLLIKTMSVRTETTLVEAGDAIESFAGLSKNKEIKVADTRLWYCTIIVLRTMHWLRRRYQINLKKIYNEEIVKEDKRPAKVALIPPPALDNLPKPEASVTQITDNILDMFASLMSICRHERATQAKFKPPAIPESSTK